MRSFSISIGVAVFSLIFGGLAGPGVADVGETRATLMRLADNVHTATLSNGLRVVLYRRGVAPVFAGAVGVRVGGTDEKPGHTGIAHMLEHMAFKGTTTIGTVDFRREKKLLDELEVLVQKQRADGSLPEDQKKRWDEIHAELEKLWVSEEFTRRYEERGAAGMNATTDSELTRYFTEMPRAAFEFWCQMESARILDPVMRQFYRERDVVMEERRMRSEDSPQGKLYEKLLGITFLLHPYQNPVIGYAGDIAGLTATQVRDFHRRYYVPSNIAVSLVGDVDPVRDLPVLEKYFGRIPRGPQPERPTAVEPPQEGMREVVIENKASPQMFISYRKMQYPHPDDAPVSILLEMLAGSSISPLYQELVKKRQIAAAIAYDEAPGNAYPNMAIFAVTTKAPHTNAQVLEAFDLTLARFKSRPIDPGALEIAKRAVAVEYLEHLRSNMSLAIDFVSSTLLYDNWRALIDWYDEAMRVTPADIKRVADTYLVPSNRVVARLEQRVERESRVGGE
ncbi:MAG: hypothetical protein RL417_1297 [Pseudomonadota bacterium]|jgi:predicted Zn-dependent peptidase